MASNTVRRARTVQIVLVLLALGWSNLARAGGATPEAARLGLSVAAPPISFTGKANFLGEIASQDAQRVANWVLDRRDNGSLPFVIIDKIRAKVFVFDASGQLRGASFALLGKARGDESVPGIGNRKLSTIRPEERTTPAGRFVARLGHDFVQDILWIDYATSLSLHRVIRGTPGDHRLQRLATDSPLDKRISYGCVNVPVRFYEDVVVASFTGTTGIIYILPEVKTLDDVFAISDGGGKNAAGHG